MLEVNGLFDLKKFPESSANIPANLVKFRLRAGRLNFSRPRIQNASGGLEVG